LHKTLSLFVMAWSMQPLQQVSVTLTRYQSGLGARR